MTTTGRRVGVVRDAPQQLDGDRLICLLAHEVVLVTRDGEDRDRTTDRERKEVSKLADTLETCFMLARLRNRR
jgi:hypothetical protein